MVRIYLQANVTLRTSGSLYIDHIAKQKDDWKIINFGDMNNELL